MINWNPFKPKLKPVPMNGTTVEFYGPGSHNVQVIDLSANNTNQTVNGVQIIYGQNPPVNQKIAGEVPMYGQGQIFGFVPVQPPYQVSQNFSYQAQNPLQQINHAQYNGKKGQSSNIYPDLEDSSDPNLYGQFPKEQVKQNIDLNLYAKQYAKGNQANSGNPYY